MFGCLQEKFFIYRLQSHAFILADYQQSGPDQVSVQPPPSAVNTTLPAFAAECHAAAPLLLSTGARNA